MKDAKIEDLAYVLKEARDKNQPKPIFFLGAGASKSGNIPLASEIANDILKKYSKAPTIKRLEKEEITYHKLMDCLQPDERGELLREYIDGANINVTHIYLAQLICEGFVDYVLTVNFDNLMLRALALYNEFPPTYDMAILKDLTTSTIKEKSVVFLHGQHHGPWLLNTKEEMEKVEPTIPRIFDTIKHKRPWVFVGYSGGDPIFKHIKKLGRFDNGLYWITNKSNDPKKNVIEFLEKPNTNAFIIKGYDSDSFMLKLHTKLELDHPEIIHKPFTSLEKILKNIVDIEDDDHFKSVKERLEITKEQVSAAINQFEKGKILSHEHMEKKSEIDLLKREIIDLGIKSEYHTDTINEIYDKAKEINDNGLNDLLSILYFSWGTTLGKLAKTKGEKEAEELYNQAFDKYQKAIEIKPDKYQALYNWGIDLGNLAKTKEGKEAEELYNQAFDKYQKAIDIKPDKHDALHNWGTTLGNLAKTKEGKEAEELYNQAFDKYQKTIDIKPDDHQAYDNWGVTLIELAKIKEGKESESLHNQAFDKYQKAIEHGGSSYNLSCIYAVRGNKEQALKYLNISLSKNEIDVDFVEKDEDWKEYSNDNEFLSLLKRFKK